MVTLLAMVVMEIPQRDPKEQRWHGGELGAILTDGPFSTLRREDQRTGRLPEKRGTRNQVKAGEHWRLDRPRKPRLASPSLETLLGQWPSVWTRGEPPFGTPDLRAPAGEVGFTTTVPWGQRVWGGRRPTRQALSARLLSLVCQGKFLINGV